MPFQSYDTLLRNARSGGYAVGAFNIFALEFLPSILKAADELSSPVLLQINPIHFYLTDLPEYLRYIKAQIAKAKVPVCLNLDHGKSKQVILQGIQAGFPSVMFDGSKLPYSENLRQTKEIVELCHAVGVTVEAELGTLNDEGLEITAAMRDRLFTDPNIAAEFVAETGVDALAVAIGNAHGFYKGDPNLDFERLEQIREKVPVPLVLHGGSGISDADFKRAISLGINKINIYTDMSAAAFQRVKEITASNVQPVDYPSMLYQARLAVEKVVQEKMRLFGSVGKGDGSRTIGKR